MGLGVASAPRHAHGEEGRVLLEKLLFEPKGDVFEPMIEAELGIGFSYMTSSLYADTFRSNQYSPAFRFGMGVRITKLFAFSAETEIAHVIQGGALGTFGFGFKFYLLERSGLELWTKLGFNFAYAAGRKGVARYAPGWGDDEYYNRETERWESIASETASKIVPWPMLKASLGATYMFSSNVGLGADFGVNIFWVTVAVGLNAHLQFRF